ncbi:MAG: UDP-N-acetylmuramoyl-L-alanyl-D-glutamate--2,6-diaminopimelate ligase, partial [Betaproteobacteria bacterium]|nr:UDP-N-acetylmuramoyl-L-alanyl-D-glutamate--2,6-diaminopimelate ligase [Candidatus Fonsibacter lacus]
VVVDYAHTPDALSRALDALVPETEGRLCVVFGCGGDRDRGKRALMARAAEAGADVVIVTSDNPRGEAPQAIVDDVVAGLSAPTQTIVDRREAIETALAQAKAGDTVLIAGKGHENYQEVAGKRYPFSDVAVAQAFFAEVSP